MDIAGELEQAREALAAALEQRTADGKLEWTVVHLQGAECFVARARGVTFLLSWRMRERPEMLVHTSSVVLSVGGTKASVKLWDRVMSMTKASGIEPERELAHTRGATLIVTAEGAS